MRPAAARRLAAACLLSLLVSPPVAAPIQVGLDRPAVADALRTGRSTAPAELDRFHDSYRIPVDDPVVRQVEIVSEFRRLVQLTEERERLRDATWDVARAADAARGFRGLIELAVFLQFSPQNTYRTMPAYSLAIYRRGGAGAILPIDSRTRQAYIGGQPAPPGTPILSGSVTATFDAGAVDPSGQYLVAILLDGREVRRVPVDLGSVR